MSMAVLNNSNFLVKREYSWRCGEYLPGSWDALEDVFTSIGEAEP